MLLNVIRAAHSPICLLAGPPPPNPATAAMRAWIEQMIFRFSSAQAVHLVPDLAPSTVSSLIVVWSISHDSLIRVNHTATFMCYLLLSIDT